jgi:hypothetical protein
VPKSIAKIAQSVDGDARISQHVDAQVAVFHGALDFSDNGLHWTHVGHRSERNETVAHPAEFRHRIVVRPDAIELERRVVVKESSARAVGKQNLAINPVSVQRLEPLRWIVDFPRHFLPTLRIIAAIGHRRWAIADIAALNLAIHQPALDRSRIFLILDLDDVGNSIAPTLRRHARRIGVLIQLAVRVGTDQTEFNFHF